MQVPPEISISGVERTPFIEGLIAEGIAGLEQVCSFIISTRIALERAQRRRQTGDNYRMRIHIRIPGNREITVRRYSVAETRVPGGLLELESQIGVKGPYEKRSRVGRSPARRRGVREDEVRVLVNRAFGSARRELEKTVDKIRRDVKLHEGQQTQAIVEKLFREQDYGFLRAVDGEQVYFHRNSVLHGHWEKLVVGAGVRYSPELGEKGLQASTVELLDKPGAAEQHEQMHDLPEVSTRRRRRG